MKIDLYHKYVRDDLQAIVGGNAKPPNVNRLISLSHAIAYSFLSKKEAARILPPVHGMNVSDLAYDCIADLFQKDRDENYIQLQAYFTSISIETITDRELLVYFRRLIFSKVNQGVYRLYSEVDPSLTKIFRNIKIAIATLKSYSETERFGEPCVYPCLCETQENYPSLSQEELVNRFSPMTTGREKIPELLAKLSVFLREQQEYSRILPLAYVGLLFRSIYILHQESPVMQVDADVHLIEHDTRAIIDRVCSTIRSEHTVEYLQRKNIDTTMFNNYFNALAEALCEKYIGKSGTNVSLYENLRRLSPELSFGEYKQKHRNKIEYLWKKANKEVVMQLKIQGQIP